MQTYDGRNSEAVLLGIVEELEDVITDDDTFLARENVCGTHCCSLEV
jgi:hypothetical protein